MDVEARMTLCNMTIEWGARSCLIAPDEKTFAYCRSRPGAPSGDDWDAALAWWRGLPGDSGAVFDREIELDCTDLGPQVTWGTDPAQTVSVDEPVPDVSPSDPRIASALQYMGLEPRAPLAGVPVDRVFIGSCSNSRLSDLRDAAEVVRGRTVAAGVTAIIVPGSSTVKRLAEREGLDKVFEDAGFLWRNSGCSMCAGSNGDIAQPGERCVSTTNRNFENRQGRGVRTHLASPVMAAAAAVTGRIVDVREFLAGGA
jgi:3-isopropylmalate/(R)-2-methylmalate dehydratase large subunit